jgi:ATP-dependent protease ClpP protease subunit
MKDIDRDRFMTPEEAVEYGIVDAIMENRTPANASNGVGLGSS